MKVEKDYVREDVQCENCGFPMGPGEGEDSYAYFTPTGEAFCSKHCFKELMKDNPDFFTGFDKVEGVSQ